MAFTQSFMQRAGSSIQPLLNGTVRDCQWQAARCLTNRSIAEVETGEGKTVIVALASAAIACRGQRVFIATANDYLASRDATTMGPLYESLGLRVAAIQSSMPYEARRRPYEADVIYGTIREYGFDRLRDELAIRNSPQIQPFVPKVEALVLDEADSVLLDDASMPLVIHKPGTMRDGIEQTLVTWCKQVIQEFVPQQDYQQDRLTQATAITSEGVQKLARIAAPAGLESLTMPELLHGIERAIDAQTKYLRDVHYVLRDDRVILVDQHTGRLSHQRSWGDGIHQAIEAKEGVPITARGICLARMTVQELVNGASYLCGVTATAQEDRHELAQVYGLQVQCVAPHRPSRRVQLRSRVFATQVEKYQAIAEEIKQLLVNDRAVLVGTRSIEQSEALAEVLRQYHLTPEVLNARQSSDEAQIIANAGQVRRVTVATNMAGRGTDIKPDPAVLAAGGLHVIVAEPNWTRRLDRQLIGRCGRQGDPGSYRRYFAEDDFLLHHVVPATVSCLGISRFLSARLPAWMLLRVSQAQREIAKLQRMTRARLLESEQSLDRAYRELGLNPHLDRLER